MKIIQKEKQEEEAYYISDFQNIGMEATPHIELTLDFGYGSQYDGDKITLHLTDKEIQPLLETIKKNAHPNFKETLKKQPISKTLIDSLT
jgi:hypothetical protein